MVLVLGALTPEQVQHVTGIAASNVRGYLTGRCRPSPGTAARLAAAGALDPASDLVRYSQPTYVALALGMRELVHADPAMAVRACKNTVAAARAPMTGAEVTAFHLQPPSTGHRGFDALLAGLADHTHRAATGVRTTWAGAARYELARAWSPLGLPARAMPMELLHTLPEVRSRKVALARWEVQPA